MKISQTVFELQSGHDFVTDRWTEGGTDDQGKNNISPNTMRGRHNKASGPDGISHRMLKNTCRAIATPLCKLFNLSPQTNTFPILWKLARVMPIINKNFSSHKSIIASVPQGFVLGPFLFLIYINDISDDWLFADDTSLSYSSADLHQIEINLNKYLRKLNEWAKKWLILFNPLKQK